MMQYGAVDPGDLPFEQFMGILAGNKGSGSATPKKSSKHQLPTQTKAKVKAEKEPCGL